MIVKIKRLLYFIIGRVLFKFHYDKKYCTGKYFSKSDISSEGWRMAVKSFLSCKRLGQNMDCRFPVSALNTVTGCDNIQFDNDDLHIFQGSGKYFQAIGKIAIGKGTFIAMNVGIITANHSISDLKRHDQPKDVVIGENCWIGMNSMILPGVVLGNRTVVGAGSIVTKSFPEGNCVLAGNPAKVIKRIEG